MMLYQFVQMEDTVHDLESQGVVSSEAGEIKASDLRDLTNLNDNHRDEKVQIK